ncbi:hypothetical protein Hanom_Chr00s134243g01816501 [Helianthus anomalus]
MSVNYEGNLVIYTQSTSLICTSVQFSSISINTTAQQPSPPLPHHHPHHCPTIIALPPPPNTHHHRLTPTTVTEFLAS